ENTCARINANAVQPTIKSTTHAKAKNITLAAGSKLTIENNASLTVTDFIHNNAGSDGFIVNSGGSLVQHNDYANNSGNITVKRTFTFSSARKQYNYIITPVKGQSI